MSASHQEALTRVTSRNVQLHEALAEAVKMLQIIRSGGSFPAMEYHVRVSELEKVLADV